MSFLRRVFPESIFPRRLGDEAERRLRLAQARAEETLVDAHVTNALLFIDALAGDLTFDRAIDTYIRVLNVAEPLASTVATRVLVALGNDLMPARPHSADGADGLERLTVRIVPEPPRPTGSPSV